MFLRNFIIGIVFTVLLVLVSCSGSSNDPQPDKCAAKAITITPMLYDSASKCENNGRYAISVRGSSGFTYTLDNRPAQTDSFFKNLSPGTHTVVVTDFEGCSRTVTFEVLENTRPGPKFSRVNDLLELRCNQVCHTAGTDGAPKGVFSTDCGIIERRDLIKAKAVDDVMGNLTTNEKAVITDWLNEGGKFTN